MKIGNGSAATVFKVVNEERMVRIDRVTGERMAEAGWIHSVSWKDSHKAFCDCRFLEQHSPEDRTAYLKAKADKGSDVYLMENGDPIGIVTVTENLIEDLYILPEMQRKGYGSVLLRFAIEKCTDDPVLWVLDNNADAVRLYQRFGFRATGRKNRITPTLYEIEYRLAVRKNRAE